MIPQNETAYDSGLGTVRVLSLEQPRLFLRDCYRRTAFRIIVCDVADSAALLRMLPDDGDRLGWSDVVARLPVVVAWEGIEMFGDELPATRESVTTAHGRIMPHVAAGQGRLRWRN
jgi:hypothetical protein